MRCRRPPARAELGPAGTGVPRVGQWDPCAARGAHGAVVDPHSGFWRGDGSGGNETEIEAEAEALAAAERAMDRKALSSSAQKKKQRKRRKSSVRFSTDGGAAGVLDDGAAGDAATSSSSPPSSEAISVTETPPLE